MSFADIYKNSTPAGKTVIAVVGTAALAFAGWKIYSAITNSADKAASNTSGAAAASDITSLEASGMRRTLSDTVLAGLVQKIVQASNGCGTDEQAIYDAFSACNNQLDLLYLIKDFGVQYYEPCWISQADAYAIYLWDPQHYGGDLATFLNYELSSSEIAKVNSILAAKGINFKF